jgi:lysophospholipase L1-like esterase
LLPRELEDNRAVQPKADQYILTHDELDRMYDHWNYFNSVISSYSSSSDVAVLNTNDILTEVNNGFFTGTEAINAEYIQGGAFSLDAVHLTPKGYAVMANAFIQSINSKFGSNIPTVNSNNYRGVILP